MDKVTRVLMNMLMSQMQKGISFLDVCTRNGEDFPTVKFIVLRMDRPDNEIESMMRQEKITFLFTLNSQGCAFTNLRTLYKITDSNEEYEAARTKMVLDNLGTNLN